MKQTWKQTQSEIKEAYKSAPTMAKVHGEEVVRFEGRVQTPISDRHYSFDAPQCSSNSELESYMSIQNRLTVESDSKVSFRIN